MKVSKTQEFVAELIGTMILVAFGCGVVAMVTLFASEPAVPGEVVKGGYTNVVIGWGLAVFFGIVVSGAVSGAHLNPAVTLALAATGRFSWSKTLHYVVAQVLGAFLGAAIVYAVYAAKWLQFDPALEHTASILATFPAIKETLWPGFVDQVVGTALLVGLVLAVGDRFQGERGQYVAPVAVALLVMAIGLSFGGMHGYAINPARDLGPRLFALAAGFKNHGFEQGVWLVPVLGPLLGGLIGAFAYDALIGRTLHRLRPGAHQSAAEEASAPSESNPVRPSVEPYHARVTHYADQNIEHH